MWNMEEVLNYLQFCFERGTRMSEMQQTSVSGTQDADVYSETYKLLMSGWGLFNKVAQLLGTKNSELFVYLYVKKFPPIELDKEEKKQLSLKQEESTPRVEALKKALEIFKNMEFFKSSVLRN